MSRRRSVTADNTDAFRLFNKLNSSNSDTLSKKDFVDGLITIKECDMTEQECDRLFHILSPVGSVSLTKFVEVCLLSCRSSYLIYFTIRVP